MSDAPPDVNSAAAPIGPEEAARLFAEIKAQRALVAVSGGPDSLALLCLVQRWAKAQGEDGPEIHAATIDHGLRAESRAEAEHVGRVCSDMGVPHAVLAWLGKKPSTAIQAEAREARIRLLAEHCEKIEATVLMLAHHADDQAETVLMRMCRGSGLRGLSGIRPLEVRGIGGFVYHVERPLLAVPKARLVATCRVFGVVPVEDPSNADPRFARTRMRALLPLLAHEGLDAAGFSRLARRMLRADEALVILSKEMERGFRTGSTKDGEHYDALMLAQVPDELSLRILDRALLRHATEGQPELAALEALHEGLIQAIADSRPFSQTLAGAWVRITRGRVTRVTIGPAPKRRETQPRQARQAEVGKAADRAPKAKGVCRKSAEP